MLSLNRFMHVGQAVACGFAALALVALMFAPAAQAVEITNTKSGLKVDVMWASQAPYQGVFLWPDNASASQEFDLLPSGSGYYRIRARHSGQCLMPNPSQPRGNGRSIIQYPSCDTGFAPLEWQKVYMPVGCWGVGGQWTYCQNYGQYPDHMVLKNRGSGMCLDVANSAGGTPRAEMRLQQWECLGNYNQLFLIR